MKGGGDGEAELGKKQRKDVFVRGVLSVTIVAAEDLPSVDFMGKADPYVVLTMKKCETKAKTRVRLSVFSRFTAISSYSSFILK